MKVQKKEPLVIKDCALIALATGRKARTLKELRDNLEIIESESIYYHFWGSLLRPRFEDAEYHNDFAAWAAHSLNDKKMAEQLGVVDPTTFTTMDNLRFELLEIIDERIDELDVLPTASRDKQFEFISSEIVVFTTMQTVIEPEIMKTLVLELSLGSIFYHFIDARRRTSESIDDFSHWLMSFGDEYEDAINGIADIDPYFSPLTDLRNQLSETLMNQIQDKK
ncbi:MAG: DUF5752 family protein [Candidatus Marinimicrobia bacterium]|nr:DUF5752 family protein [Candidatus Neomarinimicrobiota bacterium]